VLGLLPMALQTGEGAEMRSGMAICVIVGLITSTLLTLFVVPVVYTLIDDLAQKLTGKRVAKAPSDEQNAEAGAA